jgi:uroporphyrinogen decarboxylase
MSETMTPRERVLAALRCEDHDRVPVGLLLFSGLQHDLIDMDYTWGETFYDSDKLFHAVERQHTEYGCDYMIIPIDFRNEAEAFGSTVTYNLRTGKGMRLGMVTKWMVEKEKDLASLKVYDPKKVPRMALTLEVVSRLRKKYPNVAIFGFVNGIANTQTDIVNDIEEYPGDSHGHFKTFFRNILRHPKLVHSVNEIIVEGAIAWGKALLEAGCDAIHSHESMSWLGLTPAQYAEFVTQYHAKVVKGIGAPYIFHECNAKPVIDHIAAMKPACVLLSETVDLRWAGENYGDKICFQGNLAVSSPSDTLWSGTWERVKQAAKDCIEIGKTMKGFILSAGCEVHFCVPRENIKAISQAAREYGKL